MNGRSREFVGALRRVGLLLLLQAGLAAGAAAQPSFTGIGSLLSGGVSTLTGLSGDGMAAVGGSTPTTYSLAILWTQSGGLLSLGELPGGGVQSYGNGISADGTTLVGQSAVPGGQHAFRWTHAGGLQDLGDLPLGANDSAALDASTDGSVVVGYANDSSGQTAFRWTQAGGLVSLGSLPGGTSTSVATAVSDDGSVVTGYADTGAGFVEAFVWTQAGGMVGLGLLPGTFQTLATEVSADGSTVFGGAFGTSLTGFRWDAINGMQPFPILVKAANTDGSVVVGAEGNRAKIWDDANGVRDIADILVAAGIDMTGWSLYDATGVSSDGNRVAGLATNPSSVNEGWVAMLAAGPVSVPVLGGRGALILVAALALCVGVAGLGRSATTRRRLHPSG